MNARLHVSPLGVFSKHGSVLSTGGCVHINLKMSSKIYAVRASWRQTNCNLNENNVLSKCEYILF